MSDDRIPRLRTTDLGALRPRRRGFRTEKRCGREGCPHFVERLDDRYCAPCARRTLDAMRRDGYLTARPRLNDHTSGRSYPRHADESGRDDAAFRKLGGG